MSSQPDVLEELARVYARAAVDEFLAAAKRALPGDEAANEREVVYESNALMTLKPFLTRLLHLTPWLRLVPLLHLTPQGVK